MALLTIGGVLAALGTAVTTVASAASFLANVATIPFRLAGDNKVLATGMYWIVFAIDSFIFVPLFSAITQPFFDVFGIEGVQIGFTSIYLTIINIFTGFLFGWFFVPYHLLMMATLILIIQGLGELFKLKARRGASRA